MGQESESRTRWWFAASVAVVAGMLVTSAGVVAQEPAAPPPPAVPASSSAPAQAVQAPPPSGPGADAFQRVCVVCHPPDRIVSVRKTRTEWEEVIDKMITKGAQVTDDNYGPIEDFLLRNYGTVNVNKAVRDDLVAIVGVTPAEATSILAFRTSHGPFADFAALSQVPGIDTKKLEQKKAALTF